MGNKLIDMVWSMRRKIRINTQKIYKWKVRQNVHGGQQDYGMHYWETYAPVVAWQTLRIFMILSLIQGRQVFNLILSLHILKLQLKNHSA